MKERPIIFSESMVRAIRDGRKTQTRRVVKPQPDGVNSCGVPFFPDGRGPVDYRLCPYGSVGEKLWVRETWGQCAGGLVYKADSGTGCPDGGKWKPSIHMPRWASRITLEITGVRVERLQEISEWSAREEGVEMAEPFADKTLWNDYVNKDNLLPSARQSFASLWESIHGQDSWSANPWVWVIEFRRIQP